MSRAETVAISQESGSVPHRLDGAPPSAITALLKGDTLVREEFRILRSRIRALGASRPIHRIGVVSASAGEGKSFVAFGLARAMAQEPGHRVLLVEGDLRRPRLERYLGLTPGKGLGDWLGGSEKVVCTRRLPFGFDLLPAGTGEHPDLLGGSRMASLLEAAQMRFDTVIVDCPPLMPVADSAILQDLIDGVLFVVRSRHSPRDAIAKAVARLKSDRILGFVYNGHREIVPSQRSYAYRQYGYY